MKLIIIMLIVSTFARYNQMRNFRKHHGNTMEKRSDKELVYPSERLGSSVDKAAFRQYSYQKYAEANGIQSRERLSRWFDHFKKYTTVYKYWKKQNKTSTPTVSHNLIMLIFFCQTNWIRYFG